MGLTDELIRCGAVKFGNFTLTSGKQSPYYVDVKMATSQPRVLREIAKGLKSRVGDAEGLAGVELGAVPILVALSLESGLPLSIIRKGERVHGTGKRIEGADVNGRRVLLVEDVTTTGKSVLEGVRVLREAGAQVTRVETVVDREEGGKESLAGQRVVLGALVTAKDLLALSARGTAP